MNRNTEILSELREMGSLLANLPWQPPFVLPEGYFALLANNLTIRALAAESEDVSTFSWPKALPFAVPGGYIDHLAEGLTQTSRSSIALVTPYDVPQRYFETLPSKLLSIAKEDINLAPRKKTIDFRLRIGRAVRVAAAAALVLGLSFGGYQYLHHQNPDKIAAKQLSKLDDAIVDAYISQHMDDFDSEGIQMSVAANEINLEHTIHALDAPEIQDYLQDNEIL